MNELVVDEQQARSFESLLREHDRAARSFAFRLVGASVDDVLQDAYIAAFQAFPSFRRDASFSTWLLRIVYTTALNHRRSSWRRLRRDDRFRSQDSTGRDLADGVADRLAILGALSELEVEHRAVLVLIDGHGLAYRDAAAVLGVNEGTVASRLNRGRERMRTLLAEKGRQ